ncbi:MAG: glutamate synthase-related protein [Desulfobacterales bacterium]
MPEKYHISTKETTPRFPPVGKYTTVEFREDCAGSCRECVKKNCVYHVFEDNTIHIQSMNEPEYLYACRSCFRCVQECTKGIFSRVINPEYRTLGDTYYRADMIHQTWYQAHTGKVPVSGAGYRGPFAAAGFDSMWTDMSEIVRPTRDGIHGREYINTSFELSGREISLQFDENDSLVTDVSPIMELPLPLMFQLPEALTRNSHIVVSAAKAAHELQTMMFMQPEDYCDDVSDFMGDLIPCLTVATYSSHTDIIRESRAVELSYVDDIDQVVSDIRGIRPDMVIVVGLPLDRKAASRVQGLAHGPVDTFHLYADAHGNEKENHPRFLKEMIREIHLALVETSIRQKVNLVFSGGIAMAEHMAKAIICGADAVVADTALLLALECRLCYRCCNDLSCPVGLGDEFDTHWGSRRIVNLIGAWHSQLIEVMGAMGIREARRLRGEVGRSMWFEDLERDHFGPLFGERKVPGPG